MKHPFYTLYYTGLAILLSLSSLIFLFGYNFSNVLYHLTEKKKLQTPFVGEMSTEVLETKIPKIIIETKGTKVEKPVTVPPPQQQEIIKDTGNKKNVENDSLSLKSEEIKDTNVTIP